MFQLVEQASNAQPLVSRRLLLRTGRANLGELWLTIVCLMVSLWVLWALWALNILLRSMS